MTYVVHSNRFVEGPPYVFENFIEETGRSKCNCRVRVSWCEEPVTGNGAMSSLWWVELAALTSIQWSLVPSFLFSSSSLRNCVLPLARIKSPVNFDSFAVIKEASHKDFLFEMKLSCTQKFVQRYINQACFLIPKFSRCQREISQLSAWINHKLS